MKTKTTKQPSIFLTDYASYNNGTQFEFGHWIDLTNYTCEEELMEYIEDHFAEADEKSPLPCGSEREEIMITDFENFPSQFYSESGCDWDKIFAYIELDYENLSDDEKISHWNEYCCENHSSDNEIFEFDDDFFEDFFASKIDAARAVHFGDVNWSDTYVYFNGYGNLESTNDPLRNCIDEDELLDWLIENL